MHSQATVVEGVLAGRQSLLMVLLDLYSAAPVGSRGAHVLLIGRRRAGRLEPTQLVGVGKGVELHVFHLTCVSFPTSSRLFTAPPKWREPGAVMCTAKGLP